MAVDQPPSEIPHCAGRIAAAHERTAMRWTGGEWACPVCDEREP